MSEDMPDIQTELRYAICNPDDSTVQKTVDLLDAYDDLYDTLTAQNKMLAEFVKAIDNVNNCAETLQEQSIALNTACKKFAPALTLAKEILGENGNA